MRTRDHLIAALQLELDSLKANPNHRIDLRGLDFHGVDMRGCDFRGAALSGAEGLGRLQHSDPDDPRRRAMYERSVQANRRRELVKKLDAVLDSMRSRAPIGGGSRYQSLRRKLDRALARG